MNNNDAQAWDRYWQGAHQAGFADKEVDQPVLEAFWQEQFSQISTLTPDFCAVELACGKGAVSEIAKPLLLTADGGPIRHYCLDYSLAAVKTTATRLSLPGALVGDLRHLPLQPASIDLLFSQFGLEYGGMQAIVTALSALKPGGKLIVLMHHQAGAIYAESERNARALGLLQETQLFALATAAFTAGFAAIRDPSAEADFRDADRQLAPAVAALTEGLRQYGPQVAGGILLRFYQDLGHMFGRLHAFEPDQVLSWLAHMERELNFYRQRMLSMMASALDSEQLHALVQELQRRGHQIQHDAPLKSEAGILAWALVVEAQAA